MTLQTRKDVSGETMEQNVDQEGLKQEISPTADDDTESSPVIESPSHKLFKSRVQQYAYTSRTTRSSTSSSSTSNASSTLSRPLTGSPKRKLEPSVSPSAVRGNSPMTKAKKRRAGSTYAPPSRYTHLPLLPDVMGPGLLVLFVGLNPGLQTARDGHAYAHPSNLFWRLLHSSGITPRRCAPAEDRDMPRLFALGNTNIVARPTRDQAELSTAEMDAGVGALEAKVARWRPESVCIVGKGIWESVWRARRGRGLRKDEFAWGWQAAAENMGVLPGEWAGARVFVTTSTSGLAASMRPHEKEAVWRPLGEWVQRRRAERDGREEYKAEESR